MKYGVLWRKTTKNIGDDVQSYAESLWLPQVDYMVDIEDMEGFVSDNDEPVATIMSAWYMWKKWNWPPSKYVYPLWIGLHYNDIQRGKPRGMPSKFEYIEDGPGKEYLKSFEPIGCRDYYTTAVLDKYGIKNYFSGCVTLTLPRRNIPKPEKEYVCLVGVTKEVEKAVKKQLKDTGLEVKVLSPTRPQPSTDLPWEVRRDEVISYLETYQNAKCVITFRLHCALPCLALETPVLLVRDSFKSVRFDPYRDWLHKAYPKEVIEGNFKDFILNPPANPDNYKATRAELQKTIAAFIEGAKNETRTATELVRTNYTQEEFLKWKNDTMKVTLNSYYDEYWYDFKEYKALKKDYDKLQKECEKLKEDNKALKAKVKTLKKNADLSDYEKKIKLLDSKSVKIALKFRAFYIRILKAFKIKK